VRLIITNLETFLDISSPEILEQDIRALLQLVLWLLDWNLGKS
jgi:hypothetical protein